MYSKRRVLAQRKFAQGAVIPPSVSSTGSERRPEQLERPERTADHIVSVPLAATNLLDHVAFSNIHPHKNAGLKELRVVLNRLPRNEPQSQPQPSVSFLVPSVPKVAEKRQKQTNTTKRRMKLRSRSLSFDEEALRRKINREKQIRNANLELKRRLAQTVAVEPAKKPKQSPVVDGKDKQPSKAIKRPAKVAKTKQNVHVMNPVFMKSPTPIPVEPIKTSPRMSTSPCSDVPFRLHYDSDESSNVRVLKTPSPDIINNTEDFAVRVKIQRNSTDVYDFDEDGAEPVPGPYRPANPTCADNVQPVSPLPTCSVAVERIEKCADMQRKEVLKRFTRTSFAGETSPPEDSQDKQVPTDSSSKSKPKKSIKNNISGAGMKKALKSPASRAKGVTRSDEPQPSTSSTSAVTRQTSSYANGRLSDSQDDAPQGLIREGPRFTPTAKEAENPIQYAAIIKKKFPSIGICTVKLPDEFKPPVVLDADRPSFNIKSQYINKLFQRWSPATRELLAIKCNQHKCMKTSPLFEGVELDLVSLYNYVQEHEGLRNVLSNDGWTEIIKKLRISSKGAPEKKLEKLYFKYLLSYETMTPLEKEDMRTKVSKCWEQLHKKHMERAQNPLWRQERMMALKPYSDDGEIDDITQACIDAEECVTSSRTTTLKQFRKNAERAKVVYMGDKPNPTVAEVEQRYWRAVMLGTEHVCVNVASVDTKEHGHGFPADESMPYGSHPWNLKRICKSPDNVLSYLDTTLGITSPSLHYGMIFTTSCWHMDPHHMPWIEYHHEGPPKIWYSVPENQVANFRAAVSLLCPTFVQNKSIWLPADIVMIPPNVLLQHNVTLDRIVQNAGEFIIVYPNTYSASIDTGMTISEGAYFAPHSWLQQCEQIYQEFRENCEPTMFSAERLLTGLARRERTPLHLLTLAHNVLQPLVAAELRHRAAAAHYGLRTLTKAQMAEEKRRYCYTSNDECFYCRCTIHFSRVIGVSETGTCLCLEHGVRLFAKSKEAKIDLANAYCHLHYTNEQLAKVIASLQRRISNMIESPSTTDNRTTATTSK